MIEASGDLPGAALGRASAVRRADAPLHERPERIEIQTLVTLNAETRAVEATTCDVSEDGVKIELNQPLEPGPVTVKLPGFPIFSAEVRWRSPHHIGVKFLRPIPLDYLDVWVKAHGNGS